jgi:hypothetical protein
MSESLDEERATPKPPSPFCEATSQRTVSDPADAPDARSAMIPNAVQLTKPEMEPSPRRRFSMSASRLRPAKLRGSMPAARASSTVRSIAPMSPTDPFPRITYAATERPPLRFTSRGLRPDEASPRPAQPV